ncbi:hypothetical protein B0T26DRAFT_721184 [Lasiosphaeria miniovina]|uniref:Uncharacterized protein n=1 Tax=Lasiosphaeria miniovina TaxID=1954250 RepID=A0AA40A4W7_9PEZI|nr:uncharacterized protein B0T26DRAFT_721184 [Lasiosphaeria miniovina]KAK0709322.1 hypothetical protein B0T26DRAFT_721184 [Lasiosphaeria miniovina]
MLGIVFIINFFFSILYFQFFFFAFPKLTTHSRVGRWNWCALIGQLFGFPGAVCVPPGFSVETEAGPAGTSNDKAVVSSGRSVKVVLAVCNTAECLDIRRRRFFGLFVLVRLPSWLGTSWFCSWRHVISDQSTASPPS